MVGFWDAVASAGPYVKNICTDYHTSTSSLNFHGPDALPGAQPAVLNN